MARVEVPGMTSRRGPRGLPQVAFDSVDTVDAWAAANGGAQAVREALIGLEFFEGITIDFVKEWLAKQERARNEASAAADRAISERAAAATERSADAADRAAASAKTSGRWAGLAVLVAVAALFVSAWDHIKRWLE